MFEKNRSVRIFIGLCIIATIYLVCSGTLFDRDSGNNLRGELNRIGVQQQQADRNIERAEAGVDSATVRVRDAIKEADTITRGLDSVQSKLADGKEIIADSQRRIRQCLEIVQEAKRKGSND